MAYQTGTATSPADLLDKLRIFAAANGFTVNYWGDRTAGTAPRKALHLTAGVVNVAFHSDSAAGTAIIPGHFIEVHSHNAWEAGKGTESQTERSRAVTCNDLTGPYQAYHFIVNGAGPTPHIAVIVETSAGTFKHFGAGKLEGFGALATGVYVYASAWSLHPSYIDKPVSPDHCFPFCSYEGSRRAGYGTVVRADSDTISPRWYTPSPPSGSDALLGGFRELNSRATVKLPFYAGASDRTGRAILTPCLIAGFRGAGFYSWLGQPPNMRWIRLKYLDPGEVLTIGTDQWKVFPVIRKNGGVGQPNSDDFGYAYRIN